MRKITLKTFFIVLCFICALTFSACNKNSPDDINSTPSSTPDSSVQQEKQTTLVDELIDLEFTLNQDSRYVPNIYNKPQTELNEGYNCTEIAVKSGERYVLSFAIQSAKSCGIILANDRKTTIEQLYQGKNSFVEYNGIQITVPVGISYIYVNTRKPKDLSVKKLIQSSKELSEVKNLPSQLKLGCANCGKFSYADSTTTAEEYAENWKAMISNVDADMFMFEDVSDDFSGTIKANSVINHAPNAVSNLPGLSDCIRLSSKALPETTTVVPFDYSIEQSSKITARFYAVRFTYHIGGKHLAVYGLHLVAEGHISNAIEADGTSLSQKLRQKQFASLIADAKFYDEVIFMGDFNAQKSQEYEIFFKNGYTSANCGDFGSFATLRDIPADNIIVSKGFSINSVGKLSDYKLNTDHTAITANVSLIG